MLEAVHLLSLVPSGVRSEERRALRGGRVRARIHPEPGASSAGGARLCPGAHGQEPGRVRAAGARCCQAGTAQPRAALVCAAGE